MAFDVSETASLLRLSLYLFSLAFGLVVGGSLSETVGRMPVYYFCFPLGALFTLMAGFTKNFGALSFLRFAAGLCWAPMLNSRGRFHCRDI
jgi:MFS family permease